jgi:hypothetical protein
MKSILASAALLFFVSAASAQWMKDPHSSVPTKSDGKPDLSAPAPRTADGKVDLSGTWLADPDPNGSRQTVENMSFSQYFSNVAADLKPDEVPFQPWAKTLFMQRLQSQGKESPSAHCKPTGVPAINSIPLPFKIVQTPKLVLLLYEENTTFRQVFLDGRQPVKDAEPRWLGYSTGKWDGDTLVVDSIGFNNQVWLDGMGHPHSDHLRVTERFRRRDTGHLEIQVAINDPKAYTGPITYTQKLTLMPEEDLLEYFCSENEKDVQSFR